MTYSLELDLTSGDPAEAGFRLERLEVLNWGTFDSRVWTLRADRGTTLLTGDIGSGKSTLVDAVTTLLVPPGKVSYNKAAGAEHRERTLKSYVLGHFKTARAEESHAARAVGLRDESSYSVLLAVFGNAGLAQTVSVAQVFWHRTTADTVQKMFVVADTDMSITADFSNFGSDVSSLRRRLRAAGAHVFDAYPPYAREFRRRLGIDNAGAMELFHQTISMKSVGNLTDFVRAHMLEPFDAGERIDALIEHFDDLMRAHEAVRKAKTQVEALEPIVADLDAHDAVVGQRAEAEAVRGALSRYVAGRKVALYDARITATSAEEVIAGAEASRLAQVEESLRDEESTLRDAINRNGGDRLATLQRDREAAGRLREERRRRRDDYTRVCASLGLAPATDAAALQTQLAEVGREVEQVDVRRDELDGARTEQQVARRDLQRELAGVAEELRSLADRDTNIDARMITLRATLASACGVSEADLPFVGELIRVNDDAWRGAAERVLHGFGLSMLVPDAHYAAVSDWVDGHDLRGRLVYYRVRGVPVAPTVTDERSLVWKLDVKHDSPFAAWVQASLAKRFDVVCASTPEEFRQADDALTRRGQVKRGRERHEKDDRTAIDDRSRWILGWDNADKRRHLQGLRDSLAARVIAVDQALAAAASEARALEQRRDGLRELARFDDFEALDWQSLTVEVERMDREIAALRAASDVLRELHAQLDRVRSGLEETRGEFDKVRKHLATLGAKREFDAAARQRLVERYPGVDGKATAADETMGDGAAGHVPAPGVGVEVIQGYLTEALPNGGEPDRPEDWEEVEHRGSQQLARRIDRLTERATKLAGAATRKMSKFRSDWPLDAAELDVSTDGGDEYRSLLTQLRTDDLPRFEAQFKEMLNVNAIREVAALQAHLRTAQQQIKDRVRIINESLADIDYQPHTYIRLESEASTDADIRAFRNDLRSCTEGTIGTSTGGSDDDESYSEAKFLQVQAIVSRLKGREGHTEEDRRWRTKVTDVRTWFTFAASERVRADDSEHEHYSDSGGKSGGQKEKLAYTILAASLAYQFGLVSSGMQSKTFRFVVIDEAFGRGSDESARFGLALFERLGLQLLVVTPLQKIHVIEPFVTRVGFVHNDGGQTSKLATLTIAEYREQAQARREARDSERDPRIRLTEEARAPEAARP